MPRLISFCCGAAIVGAGISCSDGRSNLQSDPLSSQERIIEPVRWDTSWVQSGSGSDSILHFPFRVAADGRLIYLLDAAEYRIEALHRADGTLAWVSGRKGSGPREFRGPRDMSLYPNGGIQVIDPPNSRISVLDDGGDFIKLIPLSVPSYMETSCPLSDGSWVALSTDQDHQIIHLDANGDYEASWTLPWTAGKDTPSLQAFGRTKPVNDFSSCLIYSMYLSSFVLVDPNGPGGEHRYVEINPPPEVKTETVKGADGTVRSRQTIAKPRPSATDAAMLGDTIVVSFGGTTKDRLRLLDFYDGETGKYIKSYVVDHSIQAFAIANGEFFLLFRSGGLFTVVAATPRPLVSRQVF